MFLTQVFPGLFWIVLIAASVGLLVGFYKFIWFLSVGYGLAIAFMGITLGVLNIVAPTGLIANGFTVNGLIQLVMCVALAVYGFRLSLFLLFREIKNASYKKTLDKAMGGSAEKKMPIFVLISMWLMNIVLFYWQTSPVLYRLYSGNPSGELDVALLVGAIIMITGLVLEATADSQKSAQKKTNPDMAATKGVFKMCRCPNYFGEILVWTGVFVSGITVMQGWQWLFAALGYVCIVYIMFNGAKRLEIRQNKNYGDKPEYQEYVKKTPIIIPLIPLYHLAKDKPAEAKKDAK